MGEMAPPGKPGLTCWAEAGAQFRATVTASAVKVFPVKETVAAAISVRSGVEIFLLKEMRPGWVVIKWMPR